MTDDVPLTFPEAMGRLALAERRVEIMTEALQAIAARHDQLNDYADRRLRPWGADYLMDVIGELSEAASRAITQAEDPEA